MRRKPQCVKIIKKPRGYTSYEPKQKGYDPTKKCYKHGRRFCCECQYGRIREGSERVFDSVDRVGRGLRFKNLGGV